jgi:hypothetical protein
MCKRPAHVSNLLDSLRLCVKFNDNLIRIAKRLVLYCTLLSAKKAHFRRGFHLLEYKFKQFQSALFVLTRHFLRGMALLVD